MSTPRGLYHPGTSVIHNLAAGLKLGVLAAAGASSPLIRTPTQIAAVSTVVLLGYAAARLPARLVWETLHPLLSPL